MDIPKCLARATKAMSYRNDGRGWENSLKDIRLSFPEEKYNLHNDENRWE